MTDSSEDRLNQLKSYLQSLSDKERSDLGAAAHQSERGVFDLVKSGDAAGLYAALKREPGLAERQDQNGMTPLHWSGADKSGLLFEVLTQEPNAAPWTRDKTGRIPLDVMRQAGQHTIANKAERVTYPQLFQEEQSGPLSPEKVAAFSKKYEVLEKPNTRPSYARNMEPLAKPPERSAIGKDRGDREH